MAKKRKTGAKKKFFDAEIPLISSKVQLYGYDAEELEGNVVTIDLTKNLRGKNMEFKAKIKNDNGKLHGELLSLKLMPFYLRKVMRRGTDYVEDSFETECKDAKLRIKPFMLTRNRVSRAVRKEIRNKARKHLETRMKSRSANELFSEIITNKLQKDLSLKIKKIYPLALCEIRVIEIISEDKLQGKAKKEVQETA